MDKKRLLELAGITENSSLGDHVQSLILSVYDDQDFWGDFDGDEHEFISMLADEVGKRMTDPSYPPHRGHAG